jgi:hypothetical protein
MTEQELAVTLGLLEEPVRNYVPVDAHLRADILHLKEVFEIVRSQKDQLGAVNPDIWCELVPWHSMN